MTLVTPLLGGCASHEPPPPPPPRVVYVPVPAGTPGAASATPTAQPAAVSGDQPAPLTEVRVVSPGPDYVWIDGVYVWSGNAWVWEGGHWVRPPYNGAVWIGPRYYYRHGHRYWVHGYWR